jgi:hypothetical protein
MWYLTVIFSPTFTPTGSSSPTCTTAPTTLPVELFTYVRVTSSPYLPNFWAARTCLTVPPTSHVKIGAVPLVPPVTFTSVSVYDAATGVVVSPLVPGVVVDPVDVDGAVPVLAAATGARYSAWNGSRPMGALLVGGTCAAGLTAGFTAFGLTATWCTGRAAGAGSEEPPLSRT